MNGLDNQDEAHQKAAPSQETIRCQTFADPYAAMGHAVNLLGKVQPFTSYRFGELAGTLGGQIGRGHYRFAMRGTQLEGYMGWALCDEALARDWVAGGCVPTYDECVDGDACVLMTFWASSRHVTFQMIRQLRQLYPNRQAIFSRYYMDGRERRFNEVFNRVAISQTAPPDEESRLS